MKRVPRRLLDLLYVVVVTPALTVALNATLLKMLVLLLVPLFDITYAHFYPQVLYVIGICAWVTGAVITGFYMFLVHSIAHKEGANVHS